MAKGALSDHSDEREEGTIYPRGATLNAPAPPNPLAHTQSKMPDHIATPVAAPIKRNIIEPSKGDEALSAAATPTDGPVGLPPKLAMARGNALHALLQYLPDYAEDEREAQAKSRYH